MTLVFRSRSMRMWVFEYLLAVGRKQRLRAALVLQSSG